MNKIIIGKNSNIVSALCGEYTSISHLEISDYDLTCYDEIYLFSWSHKSLSDNLSILSVLPLNRVIFVSTVAVFSLAIKKQWNSYPIWKLHCENLVLDGGGKVVRLGSWESSLNNTYDGFYFSTSKSLLSNYIESENKCQVTNLTFLQSSNFSSNNFIRSFVSALHYIHDILPSRKYVRGLVEFLLKVLGSSDYGYTRDAMFFATNIVQVGYGLLGSNTAKDSVTLLVSSRSDDLLISDGFRGSRIGYYRTGLAKYWHGVSIFSRNNKYYKSVPLFPLRPKLPSNTRFFHVSHFVYRDGVFDIFSSDDFMLKNLSFKSHKLILCAGAISNSRIISHSSISPETIHLSDHEIGFLGFSSLQDLISLGCIKKMGPFIYGRRVLLLDNIESPALIDFRPISKRSVSGQNIYNDKSLNILLKLIRRFNFWDINEAFFNKFGFAFSTRRISVFFQILSNNCISVSRNNISRKRLSVIHFEEVLKVVSELVPSFERKEYISSEDGIHVVIDHSSLPSDISYLIASNKLLVAGCGDEFKLTALHNTINHASLFRKIIRRFINS